MLAHPSVIIRWKCSFYDNCLAPSHHYWFKATFFSLSKMLSPADLPVHLHVFCFSLYAGESSHLALNKLKCPHCNYIAKHRRTLKRHLIIHSGVRSFSCDICGKLFTRREHVKRHSLVSLHMHWILSRYHVTCTSTLCFVSGSFCSKGVSAEVERFGCISYFVMVGGL